MLAGRGAFYSLGDELPVDRGSYILVFRINAPLRVKTKYGFTILERGIYAYVGSAFGPGGLRARISRHWRREKRVHWHIDWVTVSSSCKHLGVFVFPGERLESHLAAVLGERFEPVPGFGASDSPEDSHLFVLSRN